MGRELGFFDDSEGFDRPDLNFCPDCKCYFASDNCTLCGKPCPEEMRAGNRKPIKQTKRKTSGARYVIPWYHSWWFILILIFVFPFAALVLAASSDNVRWLRITLIVVSAIAIVAPYLFGFLFDMLFMMWGNGA